MLESFDDIKECLEVAGEDLVFPTFTIKALPGDLTYNVQSYDSVYDVERQDVDFRISYNDALHYLIEAGNTFTYTLSNIAMTVEYRVLPIIFDTTGWGQMRATPIGFTSNVS
jgi:hypothetical protein